MTAILLEGFVFVVTVVLLFTVGLYALLRFTPLGTRLRQISNRRVIERQELFRCPIHGIQPESSLVRLKSGGVICSHCFKEAVDDVR